ncbi:hypothetical protein [Acinetobacter johnsonii]|uniref:Uncharacterized protein n=1 Tax=Acinetobacter johnsonii SH046 TaxID=575586 RepID=D0SH91_ACIJO|nr:hypothetical protein [Acinetobacter johnsonii]EEY94699.1 hypothetical protein HMPREF0016_03214 [Acinetobacter johnsonii SH046]
MKENFLEDYLQFQQTAMLKEFSALSEDDLKQIKLLKSSAVDIYQNIVESRQIGADYLYAAFTYFSSYLASELSEAQYLVLKVSYFFYAHYKSMAQLSGSHAKQKEICDLLRYIAKPILEQDQDQQLVGESELLLQLYLNFMLNQADFDKDVYRAWGKYIESRNFKEKKF